MRLLHLSNKCDLRGSSALVLEQLPLIDVVMKNALASQIAFTTFYYISRALILPSFIYYLNHTDTLVGECWSIFFWQALVF